MSDHPKKKHFLNLPKYSGGTRAFREFIAENLRYPEAAFQAKIEGSVIVEYDIHDNGTVRNQRVVKGIGYGCDEEAMRVVGLLRFDKVKNRGVRVKLTTKTTIHFKLPKTLINYTISYSIKEDKPTADTEQKKDNSPSYGYTIDLNGNLK